MKRFLLLVMPLAALLAHTAAPQQPSRPADRPEEPNFVFDDDGGKVQIVPADLSSAGNKQFHGGRVMASVQQVSIFLGAGWGESQARSREAALGDLSGRALAHVAESRGRNIKTLRAVPRLEDFSDLSQGPVS